MGNENPYHKEEVQNNPEAPEMEQTPKDDSSVNRRAFMGASAATLMGLALTKLSSESADAQVAGLQKGKLPRGSMMLLPAVQCAQLAHTFLQDPCVQMLFQHFTSQGMNFIPERAMVAVYEDSAGQPGLPPLGPSLVLIWPSFREFGPAEPSHEAASIVAVRHCDTIGGAMASHVVVQHNPFQLAQFTQLECDLATGALLVRSATRDQMQTMTPQQLADLLGPPPIDPASARPLPTLSPNDMMKLAVGAYSELLNDDYARPLYPPGGISSLMRDMPLVTRWSEAQRIRYGTVFAGIVVCTSTSSNACTSCSSTITINL